MKLKITIKIKTVEDATRSDYRYDSDNQCVYFSYPNFNLNYLLRFEDKNIDLKVRKILNDTLDPFLNEYIHEHVQNYLIGNNKAEYLDLFLPAIEVKANSKKLCRAFLCHLDTNNFNYENLSTSILNLSKNNESKELNLYSIKDKYIDDSKLFPHSTSGSTYEFSVSMLKAVLCTNTVYPIRINNNYVKHCTPGRWWDSVYTWDSGFIGMGLAAINLERSIENLKMYLGFGLEDDQVFLHHGSIVPTQFYQFWDIFNRIKSNKAKIQITKELYPRLKRILEFLLSENRCSTIFNPNFNLLRPWDYFYNSGGFDDYPAQVYIHKNNLQAVTYPMITSSHTVRFAKILMSLAKILNLENDVNYFYKKINVIEKAIQDFAWDDSEKIFSYLIEVNSNDYDKKLIQLKHSSNQNYNHGLDGLSPLFAGICDDSQKDNLYQKISDKSKYWTGIGISSVDMSSNYYSSKGYWNGAVWLPYQYLFFLTMLDNNKRDLAYELSQSVLNLWKKECERSYNCYEHFLISTQSGLGWHQFSGLSSVLILFFETYYREGSIRTGFDLAITDSNYINAYQIKDFTIFANENGIKTIVVSTTYPFELESNNAVLFVNKRRENLYEIEISVEKWKTYKLVNKLAGN